jgi:hypothetical protein
VDDKGVVRATNALISVVPYVVLPPGRHSLLLKADTPKGERMKLPWVLKESVEVEAGHFYKLEVANGKCRLVELRQINEQNHTTDPVPPKRDGSS